MPARRAVISREALDAGQVTFDDVAEGELAPVLPGEILREEFLVPLGLSASRLAREIGVPTNRITAILASRRAITAEMALKLAARFGTSPEFWMNLQTAYDLALARRVMATM